jgi:hypothetical protein
VEARQWLQRNKNLQGQAAVDAAKQQPWDSSIQALVAVPDALEKLNQDIRWTTDLGNAFLAQEPDVMSAVQRMRVRAQANGRLTSTEQQRVTTQDQEGQQVVVIEPADPEIIYVPTYDPYYVWGSPVYGFYPPLYYPVFSFGFGVGYNLGYCFSDWGGWGHWGWSPNWHGHSVFVNNRFFNHYGYEHRRDRDSHGREAWVHNPNHRLSVPYRNNRIAEQFGGRSSNFRNSYRAGARPEAGAVPNIGRSEGRSEGRFAGRNAGPEIRGEQPQGRRYQNESRQRYQTPQQYSSEPRSYSAPRVQQYQNRPQMRAQAPQQARPAPQMSAPRFSGGGFRSGGFNSGGAGRTGERGGHRR